MEPIVVLTMSLMEAEKARTLSRYDAARAEDAFYAAYAGPLITRKLLTHVVAVVGGLALYVGLLGMVGH
jgi:hypothetical protein